MQTDLEHPFLIGDHPVALYNYFGDKLGVGVPGVVVYFPLSPEFALGLHCSSIAEEIRKGQEKMDRLPDHAFVTHPELYAGYKETVAIMEGFVRRRSCERATRERRAF